MATPPSAEPSRPSLSTATDAALIDPDVVPVHAALLPKQPMRVEVAVFCKKALVQAAVLWRRFEQSALASRWSAPTGPASAPGLYLLTARAPGCAARHQTLELKEGVQAQRVEIFLEAGHALTGIVRDSTTQRPVGGARVSARQQLDLRSKKKELPPDDDAWTGVADSLGRFRLEAIGDGELSVRASAEEFSDRKTAVTLAGADGKAELALEPNGFIEGRVVAFEGAATVKDLRDDARPVFVNADGSFRLAVGSGDHLLLGEDANGGSGLLRVNVPSKATIRGVELKLEKGGKIKGTAALGGAPATCARVWIRAESDPYEIASAQVAADGTFMLDCVPRHQRYWLFGECANGEHGDLLGVEPDRPEPVELTLKRAAGLVVRVIDAAAQPVASAEVEVSQPNREPVAAVTDLNGYAELTRLVAAVVEVEASQGPRIAKSQSVQLVEGQPVALTLMVIDTGTIVGTVAGSGGLNVGVWASQRQMKLSYREKVGADGTYQLRVIPGHYVVVPWNRGYHGRDQQQEVVLAVDGKPLTRSLEAFAQTKGEPGTPVKISYRRAGADAEVLVTRAGGETK